MGDRTNVSFVLSGHIETVEALEEFCEAMAGRWMQPDAGSDFHAGDADGIKAAIAEAVGGEAVASSISFNAEEVNYGNISEVEAVCEEHKIAYHFGWGSGGDYGPGSAGYTPATGRVEASSDGNNSTIDLPTLRKLLANDDPLADIRALVASVGIANGEGMPGLSVSEVVANHLKAWMEAGDEADKVEVASLTARRAELRKTLDGSAADAMVNEAIGKIDKRVTEILGG